MYLYFDLSLSSYMGEVKASQDRLTLPSESYDHFHLVCDERLFCTDFYMLYFLYITLNFCDNYEIGMF